MVDPNANISFPPPVYVVRDTVEVRGTANPVGLGHLFLEVRALSLSAAEMDGEESPWFTATLPRIAAVVDDVLGSWNTSQMPDGLYELRLMIKTADDDEAQPSRAR